MKRIFVLLLTVSMIAAAFIGCTQKPAFGSSSADTNGNGLRDDVELEILKHRFGENADPNDYIVECYGSYNGAIVLTMRIKNATYPGIADYETVSGFEFCIIDGIKISVWYNDRLYELKDAFDSGILTVEDVENIHSKQSKK